MYRQYVTLFCILLIFYLFWIDRKNKGEISHAILVPFIWMFFSGSRPLSFWLHYCFGIGTYTDSIVDAKMEGNPYERVYLTVLIASGILILVTRKIHWGNLFKNNILIWLFFIFGALSCLWSDYPFVTFKRWIKAMGTVTMVVIILTEARPFEAIGFILRRLSFIYLPLSILFIRYYGDIGRQYHHSSGMVMYTGITDQKNSLGSLCMISCIYFTWNLLFSNRSKAGPGLTLHYSIYIVVFPMITWLLYMSNSATALACIFAAICLLVVSRLPYFEKNPRSIMTFGVVCVLVFGAMQLAFDIQEKIISMLGRRPDLTTRVPMWEDLLSMVKNPFWGFGFESFWLGPRLERVIDRWSIYSQAHNGYLEMYLSLGYIGLFFLISWMLSGLLKIPRYLVLDYPSAMFKLCIIVIAILYNYTEATFYGIGHLWLLFLFSVLDYGGNTQQNEKAIQN